LLAQRKHVTIFDPEVAAQHGRIEGKAALFFTYFVEIRIISL
jgi:hypothetical protein